MSRQRLISAAVGALCATAFIAPAAEATSHGDDTLGVLSCVLPTLTGQNDVDTVEKDLALNPAPAPNDGGAQLWLLDTDSGAFTWEGTATCGAVDVTRTAGGSWAVAAGRAFNVSAGGTYNSLVCGTGTVNGTANINGGHLVGLGNALGGSTDVDFRFGVTFAAGVGAASFVVSPGADGTGGNHVGPNVVTGGNGAGVIEIVPTGCADEGTTKLEAAGAFATSISGMAGSTTTTPAASNGSAPQGDDTLGVVSCLVPGLFVDVTEVESIEKDTWTGGVPAAGLLLDTDSGSLTFDGTAPCGAVDVASSQPYTAAGGWAVGASERYRVTGAGTFNNLVCGAAMTFNGTGNLSGPANLLAAGNMPPNGLTDIDFRFGITVAHRLGAASFVVDPGADGTGGNEAGPNVVTGGNGYGAFDVVPTEGGCVTGPGVTRYVLIGAFTTSISGNGGPGG